jgi:imidazolonepropionase-like amidohydrolase
MRKALAFIAILVCAATAVCGQERAQAYVGARIIPISGPEIADGVLIVKGGKIVTVGPRSSVRIPADAETHDVSGKVIMPGIVDTHSHIGGGAGGDRSGPIQPDVRILDSINPRDTGFKRALAGGITTVNVMPGSGHLSSGQTLYLKIRDAKTIEDMLMYDQQGKVLGALKMANGTNPIGNPPFPGTRGKSVALVREQFVKAAEYRDKIKRAGGDAAKMPPRDLGMEALVEVLDRKRTVMFHTHRADDIMSVLRLAKEFNFRVVLHHVSEGWKVADEIAKAGVPCSIIVIDSPGGKLEAINSSFVTGAVLDRAGVLVGFHTDDYITDSRFFLRSAALAVRAGMSREKALYGMTMAGARMLDLQDRVGTLEAGKDADFLVLSGDPLSVYTKVLETHIEGKKVFDRNKPEDRLFAVGGYGAAKDQVAHVDENERGEDGNE